MGQLALFTKAQLTEMRDPTRSRHYSPEAETFRREHERHRTWGLTQRHAQKLRRAQDAAARTASPPTRAATATATPEASAPPSLAPTRTPPSSRAAASAQRPPTSPGATKRSSRASQRST